MTTNHLNLEIVHPSWQPYLKRALAKMDARYLNSLKEDSQWLPGPVKIFNAFTIPVNNVNYILFGESPYPREHSANGYAFWDAAVSNLWSELGLSKSVNRATSLRNIIKMLLIAEGLLTKDDTTQTAIANIHKKNLIQSNDELFQNFIAHGFLLLNATPVLSKDSPQRDARAWLPFMKEMMHELLTERPNICLILFGRIATTIETCLPHGEIKKCQVEHPYNISFIKNQNVIDFFQPFHLLRSREMMQLTA